MMRARSLFATPVSPVRKRTEGLRLLPAGTAPHRLRLHGPAFVRRRTARPGTLAHCHGHGMDGRVKPGHDGRGGGGSNGWPTGSAALTFFSLDHFHPSVVMAGLDPAIHSILPSAHAYVLRLHIGEQEERHPLHRRDEQCGAPRPRTSNRQRRQLHATIRGVSPCLLRGASNGDRGYPERNVAEAVATEVEDRVDREGQPGLVRSRAKDELVRSDECHGHGMDGRVKPGHDECGGGGSNDWPTGSAALTFFSLDHFHLSVVMAGLDPAIHADCVPGVSFAPEQTHSASAVCAEGGANP